MTLALTTHAVEQYRDRFAPDASLETARALLAELARLARPMRERTVKGDEQWTSGLVVFVVRRGDMNGRGYEPVAVTVLPAARAAAQSVDPLLEALLRLDTTGAE